MTFITSTGYDVAAIMRDAHRRAKKCKLVSETYSAALSFYLGQVWITAQHEMRVARCTGAAVVVRKAFDNGNSPLWRL
jgi:hypothetical protein